MRCTVLFALVLGELAACSHAIHNFRAGADASRATMESSRASASRMEASRASRATRAEASRSEFSRTEVARATRAAMESSMESSMELSYAAEAASRASARASMELAFTAENGLYALEHSSMYGSSSYDIDEMMEEAAKLYGHSSMFGHAKAGEDRIVVEGSEDSEVEAAEGSSRRTVIEGSEERDNGAQENDDVVGAEDNSEGQNHVEEDSQPTDVNRLWSGVGTTLSPEGRVLADEAKFTTKFIVELNMTEAHKTGKRMGIVLNRDADFQPATVFTINKNGMVEDWNKRHPDKAVHVGDEITQVNDIQWHANTETFISRIGGQFQSARSLTPGAKDTLSLYIQRPRIWEHKAFIGQRWDAHQKEFAAEFIACISMPDELDDSMEKVMGWQLALQQGKWIDGSRSWIEKHGNDDRLKQEWKPVVIKYVNRLGNVEAWNKEHPDKLILEGDEILQLDNVRFHHNASSWMKTLQKHYRSATKVHNSNRSALVYIRRPRLNQEEFDATHPVKDIVTWRRPKHSVQLVFPQTSGDPAHLLGWDMLPGKESDRGSLATVIKKVRPGFLTDTINDEHPETGDWKPIAAGDLIVEVNGLGWEKFDKASDFYAAVDEALKEAGKMGPAAEPVNLVLERPSKLVRKVRENMERGVHMSVGMHRYLEDQRTTTTTEMPPLFGERIDGPVGPEVKDKVTDKDEDEVTGASEDDDNDVLGASEEESTGASEDSPSGAKDVKEESEDDAP